MDDINICQRRIASSSSEVVVSGLPGDGCRLPIPLLRDLAPSGFHPQVSSPAWA